MESQSIDIRELTEDDMPPAVDVVRQLRGQLDAEELLRRVAKQRLSGYRMFGAFSGPGVLVGVIGFRPVSTLARGDHLHIDDLVVDRAARGQGAGVALMEFAERWATERELGAVFLDSRPEVIGFYSALGYAPHTATLVKKRIGPG